MTEEQQEKKDYIIVKIGDIESEIENNNYKDAIEYTADLLVEIKELEALMKS